MNPKATFYDQPLQNLEQAHQRIAELEAQLRQCQETEAALKQFKSTLDKTLDCIFMVNEDDLKFFYVNQGATNHINYEAAEMMAMTPLDLKPELTEAQFRAILAPLQDGSQPFCTFEALHRTKTGTRIPVEIFAQYIPPADEQKGYFVEIVRDITARKEAEKHIKTISQISQQIAQASSAEELLAAISQPAMEAGATFASLNYIELNEAGQPEWMESISVWPSDAAISAPVGVRYHLPDFPVTGLWFAEANKPLIISNVATHEPIDKESRDLILQMGVLATVTIPLMQAGRWIAVVFFNWREPHPFSEQEVALYQALPDLVSPAVENRRLVANLEKMVAQRVAELDRLYEMSADMMGTAGFDGYFKQLNPVWTRALGYTEAELKAKPFIEFIHPDDRASTLAEAAKIAEGATTLFFTNRYQHRDGSYKWIEWNSTPSTEEQLIYFVAREVTERREMEMALQSTTERINSIIAALPDIIFVIDEDGRYVEILTSQETTLYAPVMQTKGRLMHELFPQAEADLFLELIRKTIESDQPQIIEYPLKMESGMQWFEGRSAPMPTRIAGKRAVVFVSRDITTRKATEAERERLQQELIAAQQHAIAELSTPIIPIMQGIIILPLVGSIDTGRAREITRSLLAGISKHRAATVIIDITGVMVVDSGVAAHLDKTIQAARLKGARTIISGISDAVAETIVDLGINWSRLETVQDLQTGLRVALSQNGQKS
jgi:PAS domain S-box-containing protein